MQGAQVYVAGDVSPPASFGSHRITSLTLGLLGVVARLTDADPLATVGSSSLATAVALYPNPAHRTCTVRVQGLRGTTPVTLTLVDALGRVVGTQQLPVAATEAAGELSLRSVAPGLYRLLVQTGTQLTTHVLVVD